MLYLMAFGQDKVARGDSSAQTPDSSDTANSTPQASSWISEAALQRSGGGVVTSGEKNEGKGSRGTVLGPSQCLGQIYASVSLAHV